MNWRSAHLLVLPLLLVLLGAAGGPPKPLDDEAAKALVAQVAPEIERMRGLAFRHRVPVSVVDDAKLREYALNQIRAFDQEQHLRVLTHVYRLLGLMPADQDVIDSLLDAIAEQAGGFYDPTTGGYFLLQDAPPAAAALYTAHELTHAVEDQQFDLGRRQREVANDDDLGFALSAVEEGSASILMTLYAMRATMRGEMEADVLSDIAESEAGRAEKLAALPPVLLRQLLGPYVLGPRFLQPDIGTPSLTQQFPVAQVNRAYDRPPRSSEQILHPSKYWTEPQDLPRVVQLGEAGKLLGEGFTLEGQGVFGEITLGPLVGAPTPFAPGAVEQPMAQAWTNAAASGWGGDRYELWKKGDTRVLLVSTAWDTPADAQEFAAALPRRDDFVFKASRDRVALIAGPAGKAGPKILARLLKARPPETPPK